MTQFALPPIDPGLGPTFALAGRVVPMDGSKKVLDDHVVYVRAGSIVDVRKAGAEAPEGFEQVKTLATHGTIYPGLIDLHDHLSYNVLRLWDVPKTFKNRDQWAQGDTYRKLITGPMKVLAHKGTFVPAIVRYVECKCLVGGTTTAQGLQLSSFAGIPRYYRGVVRNVEQTEEAELPEAGTHIADVEANDRDKFLGRLKKSSCLLLHLSEGTDAAAHSHFEALQDPNPPKEWKITDALAGIHCVKLSRDDFDVLRAAKPGDGGAVKQGASMIWSPLSNLLLYGGTADIKAARAAGVRVGLGPDWSPSGSKNLLGELKIARLVAGEVGADFSDHDLLASATSTAAGIIRWDQHLGSIESGKRADLLVVRGADGEGHAHLFSRSEHDVELVVINGTPRYGSKTIMSRLLGDGAAGVESAKIAGRARLLNLRQDTGDPAVGELTLGEATKRLKDGLKRLPELSQALALPAPLALGAEQPEFLVLDHEDLGGVDVRTHFEDESGQKTADVPPPEALATTPLPELLEPLTLDPLTVPDDDKFVDLLGKERNLPQFVKDALGDLF